jgi:hypothetical protein
MRKQQVLDKLEKAWNEFNASFAGLSETQLEQPGVTENWSIKDLIAHISWWEEEALKHLPHIREGITPPRYKDAYGGLNAFNALVSEQKHALTLDEVRQQVVSSHQRLIDYLEEIPDELLATDTRFRRRLRLDTYSHYPEHTQAILEWRKRNNVNSG